MSDDELRQIAGWNLYTPRFGGLDPRHCSAQVHDGGRSVGFHQCSRKIVVTECGHGWCKMHAPTAELARRNARSAKWNIERDKIRAASDRDTARAAAADTALRYFRQEATHDELEAAVNAYAAALDAVAALTKETKP